MKHNLLPLLAILPSLIAPLASAAEPDAVRQSLDRAKATYVAALTKAKSPVIAALDKQIALARQQGKLPVLERLKGEREKLESAGTPPPSVPTAEYNRRVQEARKSFDLAYENAVKAYLKAGKDEEAKAIDSERAAFEPNTSQGATAIVETDSPRRSADAPAAIGQARTSSIGLDQLTAASVQLRSAPAANQQFTTVEGKSSSNYVPKNPAMKNIIAKEDTGYRVVAGGLKVGATTYGDRTVKVTKVDSAFEGLTLLQTRQGHKSVNDGRYAIRLEAELPCIVFVALDPRAEQTYARHGRPDWLRDFVDTGRTISTDDPGMVRSGTAFKVLARRVSKGEFTLGPPGLLTEGNTMYFAFFGLER